ncbi:MAG: hypothetical protein KAT71_07010 [Gammaproteobacteria bacterium]|nr:hypothetical protein [Gammaproteobacteria bacterium]
MANLYRITRKSSGVVLITALLFLLVLTLLAMSFLRTGLLEAKMSSNYQAKVFALQNAELNLAKSASKIGQSSVLPKGVAVIAAPCGVTFYRITAIGSYKKSHTALQEIFATVGDTSRCKPKPHIHNGRQAWRIYTLRD